MTETPAEPLSAEEEADIRVQLAYVRREQGEPYGWQQDTARLLATLDAARAHTGSDCVLDRFGLTPHSHFCRSDEDRAALAVDEAKHLWPVSDEKPWSALELDDIRRNWAEHPERFCYSAGRWLATLNLVDPGADR